LIVDLIGHSAGSIAICHLLRTVAAGGPKVKVRNVLLLAPAARADLFYDEIVSKEDRYEALRIFTMSDNYECKDRLAGPLYTRSLLYSLLAFWNVTMMSAVCMERYLANEDAYDASPLPEIRAYLREHGKDRLVLSLSKALSPDAVEGLRSNSATHGDFDDDTDTRRA